MPSTPYELFREKAYPTDDKRVYAIVAEPQREICDEHIVPACHARDFKCKSRLEVVPPTPASVWAELQQSRVVVADITDLNPEVLCELGIAISQRERRDIILLRQSASSGKGIAPVPRHLEMLQRVDYGEGSLPDLQTQLGDLLSNAGAQEKGPVIADLEAQKLVRTARMRAREQDWVSAEVLFRAADEKEPHNWYILLNWAVMLRDQTEYSIAEKKLDEALECCSRDEDRAQVYSDRALLVYRKDRDSIAAERWFNRAVSADSRSKRVFHS